MPADPSSIRDLADRLHSASIHLLRAVRVNDSETGASAARLSALSVIVFSGGVTMSRLAAAEQVKVPTMSRLVAGLEKDGMAIRSVNAGDKRVVSVSATPRGREVLARGRELRLAALEEKLTHCTDEECRALQAAVGIMEGLFGDRHD